MFDFVFGGKRKLALIRELLEQRMREEGFDDMASRLRVKQLGSLQLLGTPEGAIVTIVETVIKSQKQGAPLHQILSSMEDHRRSLGFDRQEFYPILEMSTEREPDEYATIATYVLYRMTIEHPGRVSGEQCINALNQSAQEIDAW